MRLRSAELTAVAQSLQTAAAELNQAHESQLRAWERTAALSTATSLAAGFDLLRRHRQPVADTAGRVQAVSDTLHRTAELLRPVEGLLDVVEALSDRSPTVTLILRQLAAYAELIDFMCAREIELLCTPVTPEPLHRLGDFGDLPAGAVHEYNLIHAPPEVHALLAAHPDLTLLEVGEGSLVAAFGDIDTAPALTTVVAGVGSSDPEQWSTQLHRAHTLHTATGAATVLWLGYTAPASIPAAASAAAAERAAVELRTFHTTLRERNPAQRQVVLGYSYGSTVLGHAAAGRRLTADALVLVGSPGAGVYRAGQLGDEVYAVTGDADPIGLAATRYHGIHGVDPTSSTFGATVWESGSDHSGYWSDPEFLARMREVTRG